MPISTTSPTAYLKQNLKNGNEESVIKDGVKIFGSRAILTKALWDLKHTKWWTDRKNGNKKNEKKQEAVDLGAGEADFRKLFSPVEQRVRKMNRLQKRVQELIDSELKERKWMPEQMVR